jgi:predicted house-cleaning noncanonical NTP pyrophosphatase (MazG superfamily)
MLGYMASGEIATSEEMEEYMEYVEDKKLEEMLEIQEKISSIMTIEELREFYKENKGKGKQLDEMVMNRKNQLTQAV